MKPLKNRLALASKRLNAPFYIIEKDYLLSHLLNNIAAEPTLSKTLVFKGGTALKKSSKPMVLLILSLKGNLKKRHTLLVKKHS